MRNDKWGNICVMVIIGLCATICLYGLNRHFDAKESGQAEKIKRLEASQCKRDKARGCGCRMRRRCCGGGRGFYGPPAEIIIPSGVPGRSMVIPGQPTPAKPELIPPGPTKKKKKPTSRLKPKQCTTN